jgi:glycine amidinotransferase
MSNNNKNNYLWSCNEWDPLKEIIIGTSAGANIPKGDLSHHATNYANLSPEEYANIPKGKYPEIVYEEAEEDLNGMIDVLEDFGVKVHRPDLTHVDFTSNVSNGLWTTDQYEAYCPRDSVTVIGDKIIEGAMSLRARYHETFLFNKLFQDKMMQGASWLPMPKPMLQDDLFRIQPGRDPSVNNNEPILDPANLIRCGYDILYLISNTGNAKGAQWLRNTLGPEFTVHEMYDLYSWAHVDSTIMPLRPGLVVLNADRVDEDKVPKIFDKWDKIWYTSDMCVGQSCYEDYAPASAWIGMNVLSIDPQHVLVPSEEVPLMKAMEKNGITPIPVQMRHMRTLAGGPHCVSTDLVREGTLERYD